MNSIYMEMYSIRWAIQWLLTTRCKCERTQINYDDINDKRNWIIEMIFHKSKKKYVTEIETDENT